MTRIFSISRGPLRLVTAARCGLLVSTQALKPTPTHMELTNQEGMLLRKHLDYDCCYILQLYLFLMRIKPNIIRHANQSITLSVDQPKCSLIWMHGLGGTAEEYMPFWKHRNSAVYGGCRVKIIQAPQRWVTINQASSYSWYDLRSLNRFTEPADKVFDLDQVR